MTADAHQLADLFEKLPDPDHTITGANEYERQGTIYCNWTTGEIPPEKIQWLKGLNPSYSVSVNVTSESDCAQLKNLALTNVTVNKIDSALHLNWVGGEIPKENLTWLQDIISKEQIPKDINRIQVTVTSQEAHDQLMDLGLESVEIVHLNSVAALKSGNFHVQNLAEQVNTIVNKLAEAEYFHLASDLLRFFTIYSEGGTYTDWRVDMSSLTPTAAADRYCVLYRKFGSHGGEYRYFSAQKNHPVIKCTLLGIMLIAISDTMNKQMSPRVNKKLNPEQRWYTAYLLSGPILAVADFVGKTFGNGAAETIHGNRNYTHPQPVNGKLDNEDRVKKIRSNKRRPIIKLFGDLVETARDFYSQWLSVSIYSFDQCPELQLSKEEYNTLKGSEKPSMVKIMQDLVMNHYFNNNKKNNSHDLIKTLFEVREIEKRRDPKETSTSVGEPGQQMSKTHSTEEILASTSQLDLREIETSPDQKQEKSGNSGFSIAMTVLIAITGVGLLAGLIQLLATALYAHCKNQSTNDTGKLSTASFLLCQLPALEKGADHTSTRN